jgi:hypothetical protein
MEDRVQQHVPWPDEGQRQLELLMRDEREIGFTS